MSEATYKKITLNGETHVLKFDFNAISELEEYYNKGVHSIVNEETIGLNSVRNIFWAGMLWKNPNLKPFHVGKMLDEELEANEDFDLEESMQTAIKALYSSRAFDILNKRANKAEKKGSKKEKN